MAVSIRDNGRRNRGKQNARPQRRKGGTKWGKIILIVVLLYVGYSSYGQLCLVMELKQELARVEQAISEATRNSEEINARITYYKEDCYVEKVAREELGLVRPGEIIFMADGLPVND